MLGKRDDGVEFGLISVIIPRMNVSSCVSEVGGLSGDTLTILAEDEVIVVDFGAVIERNI